MRVHALYRIAQEALHNIIKHAHASTALLLLDRQDDELVLEVCDDGRGFDPTGSFPSHLELRSIQEIVVGGGDNPIIAIRSGATEIFRSTLSSPMWNG